MLMFSFIIYLILNAACDAYHNNHQIMYKLANIFTLCVVIFIIVIIIIILNEGAKQEGGNETQRQRLGRE